MSSQNTQISGQYQTVRGLMQLFGSHVPHIVWNQVPDAPVEVKDEVADTSFMDNGFTATSSMAPKVKSVRLVGQEFCLAYALDEDISLEEVFQTHWEELTLCTGNNIDNEDKVHGLLSLADDEGNVLHYLIISAQGVSLGDQVLFDGVIFDALVSKEQAFKEFMKACDPDSIVVFDTENEDLQEILDKHLLAEDEEELVENVKEAPLTQQGGLSEGFDKKGSVPPGGFFGWVETLFADPNAGRNKNGKLK